MFDIGFFELVLLAVVGLLVLGPERLPHAIRMGGAYLGKIRRMVLGVREEFERELNIQEMQERVKKQMEESGLQDTKKALEDFKQEVETDFRAPAPLNMAGDDNKIHEPKSSVEEDPDTRHNPTQPENEPEPLPTSEPLPEKSIKQ